MARHGATSPLSRIPSAKIPATARHAKPANRAVTRVFALFLAFLTILYVPTNALADSVAAGYYKTSSSQISVADLYTFTSGGYNGFYAAYNVQSAGLSNIYASILCTRATDGTEYERNQITGNFVAGRNPSSGDYQEWCTTPGDVPVGVRIYANNDTTPGHQIMEYRSGAAPDPGAPNVAAGACSLSDEQLVQLARAAGFAETDIPTAVAIAIAESKGLVNSVHRNPSPVSYDIGLWQVNDVAHPTYDRVKLGTNPLYNATAAHDIRYAAPNNWTPWATYNSGAYVQYMTRANAAMSNAPAPQSLPLVNCTGALGNVSDPNNTGDPTNSSDGSCSGWNPLTYVKCALKWAFVPDDSSIFQQWQTFQGTVQTKPPFSLITGCTQFIGGFVSSTARDNVQAGADGARLPTDVPGESVSFDPLNSAKNYLTGTGKGPGMYGDFQRILKFTIWLGFAYWAYNRIATSFGGKQA